MNNNIFRLVLCMFSVLFVGCENPNRNHGTVKKTDTIVHEVGYVTQTNEEKIAGFIPAGYRIFKKIYGDLNKDGVDDCIIVIKGTAEENINEDENRGKLDHNRRGIIVLLREKDNYVSVVRNDACFSSENEDGGVYTAPELEISIEKDKLYVHYAHGRYGYWRYTFRLRNTDFELIGYDASEDSGPVVNSETSINFLTGKELVKTNTNKNAEGGDEVFEETQKDIKTRGLLKLSEIKDFDALKIN